MPVPGEKLTDPPEPQATELRGLAKTAPGNDRFPARNFLLESSVCANRWSAYFDGLPSIDTINRWQAYHTRYFESRVVRARPAAGPPKTVAAGDVWPECFLHDEVHLARAGLDPDLELVRVEDARWVAKAADVEVDELEDAIAGAAAGSAADRDQLDALLAAWEECSDLRPVFATYWEHVRDLASRPTWADDLRDRLGLYHFDPVRRGGPIRILLLKYPVRSVPKMQSTRKPALARPTVLDGRLSVAFCPAPRESADGSAVDLSAALAEPGAELVHASTPWRGAHVHRAGTVTRPVPDDLADARAAHLMWLRQDWPDFADDTDAELV